MRALLLVVLVACDTGGPPDYSAQLVAHYTMDSGTGGTVADSSGNHYDGMCTVCPTAEAGKVGGALRFNGGDQQVDVPSLAAFDYVARGFSASAWVFVDMPPPQLPGCPIIKGAMWSICVTPDMHPEFSSFEATSATLTAGEWHHIAISYDGKMKRIVLDGVEAGTMAASILSENGQIILGGELIGVADDIRVYSGVLTDDEIADLVTP
ncbi:MAG TPA: LamG domain-containing protein [Kofleriaceae bacterium]|nr:LamG domain-containing protein [Kofleriaceae bacterium]